MPDQVYDLETYSNTEVIAVDQDPLGKQGFLIWDNCKLARKNRDGIVPACQQIWARPLADQSWAACFINSDEFKTANVTCDNACFEAMTMHNGATVRDLWAHITYPGTHTSLSVLVEADGGSRMFKITPT